MNWELLDVNAGFSKVIGTRDHIANIRWITEKNKQITTNICFINYPKAFDCVNHDKRWKILKEMGVPEPLTASRETGMQVKKQQLEPNMEQWIGSKLALLI